MKANHQDRWRMTPADGLALVLRAYDKMLFQPMDCGFSSDCSEEEVQIWRATLRTLADARWRVLFAEIPR